MSFTVRDGNFDVVVVAGPRVDLWPSAGVRALASVCAEMGLKVGLFGGEDLVVRGVLPLPATGGLVVAQDVQGRIHRIHARAVVKVSAPGEVPDPFPGWRTEGLIPISTALRLLHESQIRWEPMAAILGSGNRALRFGSALLESGVPEVLCIETYAQWRAKRFSGWEVERRRFESSGGRIIEARPVSLSPKSALLWDFRVQDAQGVRLLEVSHVVSAGPFRELPEIREHPVGSFLFEMEQTALPAKADDVSGWVMEEERGRYLAGKIVKALIDDLGDRREELDRVYKRAKGRLKRYLVHREHPFTPSYQGKWIAPADARRMRQYRGVPQELHRARRIASLECFEDIPCNICQTVCPTSAIEIGRVPRDADSLLTESRCTGCGICVAGCPSGAINIVQEREDRPTSLLTLPWRGARAWKLGEFAVICNRRGESLGTARVVSLPLLVSDKGEAVAASPVQLVELEVPTHLLWEARALKRAKTNAAEDEAYLESVARLAAGEKKIEISLNGEKRLVRDQVPVTVALNEIGQQRPEDALFCRDGSCGLCQITVDGVKKLACQTKIHRGMAIRLGTSTAPTQGHRSLCPCQGVTSEEVIERMKQGDLRSAEAVLSASHVGQGKCHGQLCMDSFRRLLEEEGLDSSQWIDWRFPWSEWRLTHN